MAPWVVVLCVLSGMYIFPLIVYIIYLFFKLRFCVWHKRHLTIDEKITNSLFDLDTFERLSGDKNLIDQAWRWTCSIKMTNIGNLLLGSRYPRAKFNKKPLNCLHPRMQRIIRQFSIGGYLLYLVRKWITLHKSWVERTYLSNSVAFRGIVPRL